MRGSLEKFVRPVHFGRTDDDRVSGQSPTLLGSFNRQSVSNAGSSLRESSVSSAAYMQFNCTGRLYIWYAHAMSKRSPVPESETASDLAAQIRTILSRLKRRLREQGGRGDLTPSQVSVLLRLEKEGAATVSGLARAEGMRPQSMSSIVTSLQDAGLVNGIPDPNDDRKTLISLSKKCQKRLQEVRAARQDWLTATIVQTLSAQEQQRLSKTLELLSRLTEDRPLSEKPVRAKKLSIY
jgi:DNA-binding MarR family transcriptional regulator